MLIIDGETRCDSHGNVWQDESSELFETLQEIEIYFKQYKCSLIFGNISDDWKIYIANAFKCRNDEHYKAYLPIKDCYENPDFIHKMYSVLGRFLSSFIPGMELDAPIHQFADNIIISSKFPKILALSPMAIRRVSLKFINDDFIAKALKANPRILKFLPRRRITFSIALEAVKLDGAVLQYVPMYLRGNRRIADAAIESNPYALDHVHKKISNHSSFYIKAIEKLMPCTEFIASGIIRDTYTNKQLEKMIVNFEDKVVRRVLWSLWCDRSEETDVLLIAKMKHRFLNTLETQ